MYQIVLELPHPPPQPFMLIHPHIVSPRQAPAISLANLDEERCKNCLRMNKLAEIVLKINDRKTYACCQRNWYHNVLGRLSHRRTLTKKTNFDRNIFKAQNTYTYCTFNYKLLRLVLLATLDV